MVDHSNEKTGFSRPIDDLGATTAVSCPGLPPPRATMSVKQLAFRCGLFMSGLVALAVVGLGLLCGFLAHGPLVIDGLGTRIATALNERFGHGITFQLATTSLVLRQVGPTLSIDGLTVNGADHQKVLSAPRAEVSIDPWSLLTGRVAPKRLEVFDVELRLVLLKDGSLALTGEPGSKPFFELARSPDAPPSPSHAGPAIAPGPSISPMSSEATVSGIPGQAPPRSAAMKQAAKAIRLFLDTITNPSSPIAAVDRLGIKRGRLVIDDETTNEQVVYRDLDLDFDKSSGGSTLSLSAQGPSRRWSINAHADGVPGIERHFQIDIDNLSQDELQLLAGTRTLGFDTDVPISMSFKIGLDPHDMLSDAGGRFAVGAGFFRLEDPDQEPILLRHLDGAFRWNGESRHVEIERADFEDENSHFVIGGSILSPLNEGEPWTIGLATSEPGLLGPDHLGEKPVTIDSGQLSARLFPEEKRLMIDRFAFGSGREGGVVVVGQVDWEHGAHLRLDASISPTSVRIAKRVWPAFAASPVRAWILSHFEDGILQSGSMKVDYDADALLRMRSDRAPPDGSVTLDFTLAKGRIAYLEGVPPLDDVVGSAHITGHTSKFVLTSGAMETGGRRVALSDGSFSVADADVHPTPATLSARVQGSVEAIGDILSRDALKAFASLPLDPATLKGQVDGRLEDSLILGPDAEKTNVLKVNANVTNFVAERLVGKEKLDNATMTIAVDPSGLRASGQGHIFGGPATFEIVKTGDRAPDATINVTLDDAARAKLGMSAIPGLSGSMIAKIVANGIGQTEKTKAQVELDLGRMSIATNILGLSKPAGKPAKVVFTIAAGANRIAIDPIVLDIGSLQGRGAIEMGSDNSFQGARFSSLRVSPGDDMKVDVTKVDDAFKLTIRGSTIDARPFLKALTQTPPETLPSAKNIKLDRKEAEAFKGFDVDLKSGILTGFNKEVMSGVELHLSKRGSQVRQFSVEGKFGRDGISGSMTANQRMRVTTEDAGALLSFIDLYKHMEGGHLTSSMLVGDETLDGNLEIDSFVLRDEPAMRKLVAQSVTTSQPGDSASTAARSIDANAVGFTKLKVDFQRSGSRVEMKDATMYGSAIGLSVEGWLDFVHDRVAMTGTFVPAFAVNNLFSKVPVLGFFLGGGSNEGLFAINFRLAGSTSSPTLSVNPLSAIAPGFLRKIFGSLDPNTQGTSSSPSR